MPGLSKDLLQFLRDLTVNNNRDWFQANKARFQAANAEFIAFTDTVITGISKFDKDVSGIQGKDCVFRIYRDVRFSADKSPYKIHFGAHISPGGKKSEHGAGYYFHVESEQTFIAGGCYMPPADWLKAIREKIRKDAKPLKKIIDSAEFRKLFGEMAGEKLSRPPKGFAIDDPEIELIKRKSFLAVQKLKDKDVLAETFSDRIIEAAKVLKPFNAYFNEVYSKGK